ncbi:WcbI family polysaccharide biosynthesis putative acetyltransferase [Vreelandella neptunia]|uniref:WcbI family polysaccharide biosynthesis putative acetyltransferase n=1 Tax=Vreelandella neptunia TaxID=115551 RepID=A0ABS9S1M2_9GAMM|nr:WcbI family polysaccharide biosynthesis putative acetyltransferase [Halomonas neptunia]MCH4810014.1 WcbI family polysaccharide biosynthesis putative acetyltransferase [Halomonas neptunia]
MLRWLNKAIKKNKTQKVITTTTQPATAPRRPLAYEAMIENSKSARPRFLVLSGCQSKMIAGFLEILTLGQASYHFFSIKKVEAFSKDGWKEYQADLDNADFIYTQKKQIADFLLSQDRYKDKVFYFPVINCAFFHPDIAYMQHNGERLVGPMGDYHSILITAAYFAGFTQQQTLAFFKPEVYKLLGFDVKKDKERAALLSRFANEGIDLSSCMTRWDCEGQWMRTVNHPTRRVIYEVVQKVLIRDDIEIVNHSPSLVDWVEDDLARSAEWPLYPKDGDNSLLIFKSPYAGLGKGIYFDLNKFIEYSFASLILVEKNKLSVNGCRLDDVINSLKNVNQ